MDNFINEGFKEIIWLVLGGVVVFIYTKIKFHTTKIYYKLKSKNIVYANDKYDGLIFTTGFKYGLQRYIINQVNPEYVGILTTHQNEKATTEFKNEYPNIKFNIQYNDELDIEEVQEECSTIIKWMKRQNVETNKIALDLTGGLVPFSIGAYESAKENDITIIYTSSKFEQDKLIDGTQKSIVIGNQNDLQKTKI